MPRGNFTKGSERSPHKEVVTYYSIHAWLRRNKPRSDPFICEECGCTGRLDLCNISGNLYSKNFDDYKWMCRSCHLRRDRPLSVIVVPPHTLEHNAKISQSVSISWNKRRGE
jgi:hypothetical protein